jgi:hypothetical protein
MSVATTERLENIYSMLKQHEKSLALVACSGFEVESDIMAEILFDTRAMALEIEKVLDERHVIASDIRIPDLPAQITPRVLHDQRKAFCPAYESAIAEMRGDGLAISVLQKQRSALTGEGREKLDTLCGAVIGG